MDSFSSLKIVIQMNVFDNKMTEFKIKITR